MPALTRALQRALSLAVAALIGAVLAPAAHAGTPASDPFYVAPANLGELQPGAIIRSRKVALRPALGIPVALTTWQVLYRTTNTIGEPVATAATVILPANRPRTGRQLLSVQLAYDGLAPKCQPSYALRTGSNPTVSADFLLVLSALSRGWTVVTADYEGPQNTWIAGAMAGHGVLDGIRAAEALPAAGLDGAQTPVGLFGYSGGGHATAWANELAASYAPELRLVGAAQGGIPANLPLLLGSLDGSISAGVMLGAIVGLQAAYPNIDLEQYFNAKGRALKARVRTQCIAEFALSAPFQRLASYSTVPDILAVPAIRQIALDNTLGQRPPTIPTFMFHARDDSLIAIRGAAQLADQYCAAGVPLTWKVGSGDHVGGLLGGAGPGMDFLARRFKGIPATSSCPPQPPAG